MAATWRLSFDLLSPALIVEPCSALAAQVLVDAPARLKEDTATKSEELEVSVRGIDNSRLPTNVLWGIVDAVFEALDEDYYATLQALCSLASTCRALRDHAQERLYHTVVLEDQYQFRAFADVRDRSPPGTCGTHVKVLECDVGSAWETRYALHDDEQLIPESVVDLLVNLEELETTGIDQGDYETCQPQCLTDFVMSFGDYRSVCPNSSTHSQY
ncbi:hypothetical protein C8Q80DRAFT_73199 [Daedaleopsis nitida]|nr:hypothetical protein C8Q80DRAFT_73199 [Daedaleopsis nitida]